MKLKQLVAAIVCAATTTSAVKYIWAYKAWKYRELAHLESSSQIIETALGPVEYQKVGQGPVVLVVHGTPGGYDQGCAFARLIGSHHFTFIALSRPGYLRTPLATGKTPLEQADLYAALLDALNIQQTTIIGISGGGPSALQFALRYPERCRKLVMISGVVQRYSEQAWHPLKRLYRGIYNRIVAFDPILYLILPFARLAPNAPVATDFLRSQTLNKLRKAGYDNDINEFARVDLYPLEKITAPTLAIHGTADGDVPFADARLLVSKVPNARLLAIKGGTHAVFYTHAATVMPVLRDFIES